MSKRTLRKSMEYIKKEYVRTRTMPANWFLSSYKFKFNITHMKPFLEKLKQKKIVGLQCSSCNRVFFPPRLVCGKCLVKPDRWVDLRETGKIASYTITY
ncbi:MAG: Zn-ribbon domain-containing OB-fold protein, partial [Promethearchaeota archaeon]